MNIEGGLQIGDLWGIVRRRGKVVAGSALFIVLAVYWIAMALPNQYESYATVLVTPQTVSPELVAAGVPESDLNNRLFLMTAQILSRGRLSRVIDDLELYQDQSEYMVREEVIDLMRKNVRVAPVLPELNQDARRDASAEINQFKIFFTDNNARTAMKVAQKLSNDFIEQHIDERISLSQKSLEFIEGELSRLSDQIREVEARIAEVKADNPGRLPEDMTTSQRRLEKLLAEHAVAQRALAEAISDEAFYRSQLGVVQGINDDLTPERRLQAMELQASELKARGFTPKHPDVIKLTLEMEELRQQVARNQSKDAQNPLLSPAQQNTEAERRRAELRRQSTEEEIARLESQIDEVQTLLAETPAVAELLDGLQREYEHQLKSFQDFSNRRLEATVQAQLERRQLGEQFRVLEAAFIAPAPSSPDRPLIVILGMVFAVGVGLGVGIVLEAMDSSLHTARQLQSAVGIPVLAAIPKILLEADLAALRRRRIRTALGATAVVFIAIAGGFANYVWVNGLPSMLSSSGAAENGQPPAEEAVEG